MTASIYKFLVSDYLNPTLIPSGSAGSGEEYGTLFFFFSRSLVLWCINRFSLVRLGNSMDCGFIYFIIILVGPIVYWSALSWLFGTGFILILFLQAILVLFIQLWVQLVSAKKKTGWRNKDKFSFFCWRIWMISMASLTIEYRLLFTVLTVSFRHPYLPTDRLTRMVLNRYHLQC
jgi:hypothetical protein